jgi:cobalt-zinc-cadmium efflux system protein
VATGWTPIDPILSIVVALLILRSTWTLLKQTSDVLMERVPAHLDYAAIGRRLASIPGVRDVHDLHVWSMGAGETALSAHMGIASGEAWPAILGAAQRCMREEFGIHHLALQPDWPHAAAGDRAARDPGRGAGGAALEPARLLEPVDQVGVDADHQRERERVAEHPVSSGMCWKFMP